MVDMSGLDSGDVLVVWVQVPSLVKFLLRALSACYFFEEFTLAIFVCFLVTHK